jgi:alpha-D-ribose 1-methylphosphonate 5-triphosphate synthase subunit PhnH
MSALTRIHSFDEVFDAQKVFRLLLTAMSSPAKTVNIGEYAAKLHSRTPAMLAVAMTILDNEVSFFTAEDEGLADEIAALTLSRRETLPCADYLFVTDGAALEENIGNAKCGTLADPHKSATLIAKNTGAAACRLRLQGPGIKGAADVAATELVARALKLRDAQQYELPQGIDFIFVSDDGDLLAIPRLTRMEVL